MKKNIFFASLAVIGTLEFNVYALLNVAKDTAPLSEIENEGSFSKGELTPDDPAYTEMSSHEEPTINDSDSTEKDSEDFPQKESDSLKGALDLNPEDLEKISSKSPELEEQENVLQACKKSLPVKKTIEGLTERSVIVTYDTLDNLKENPEGAIVKIDLFEGVNLFILMRDFLDAMEKDQSEAGQKLMDQINSNAELKQSLKDLRSHLADLSSYGYVCFEDEEFFSVYSEAVDEFLKIISLLESNDIAKEIDYFRGFFTFGIKFIQLIWVRHSTEHVLSMIRSAIEAMQGQVSDKSATLTVNLPTPASFANVESTFGIGQHAETSAESFLTVSKSAETSGGVTIGINLPKLKVLFSGKIGAKTVSSDIFFSLEGLVDKAISNASADLKRILPNYNEIKKVADDRRNMQNKEKEVQKFTTKFVFYLKALNALPQSVVVEVTDLSRSDSSIRSKTYTSFADAGITADLDVAGITASARASASRKTYLKDFSPLGMLNSDCSLGGGMTKEEFLKIIGKEFDKAEFSNETYLRLLLKDLTSYIIILVNLADDELSKVNRGIFTKKKHALESRWMPKKLLGSYGRGGMLRAFMAIAVRLADMLKDNPNYAIITKKIYEQLCVLAKLEEFSKNKTGIRKTLNYGKKNIVVGQVNASITEGQLTLKATTPLGDVSILFKMQKVTGSPFKLENISSMLVEITLPIASTGVIGMKIVKQILGKFVNDSSKKSGLKDFAEVAKALCVDVGGRMATEIVKKSVLSKVGGLAASGTTVIKIGLYKMPKGSADQEQLDGMDLAEKSGKWTMDSVIIYGNKTLGFSVSASSSVPVGVKVAILRGDRVTMFWSLRIILSKLCALLLGIDDHQSGESTAIKSLLKGQSAQLFKIFRKISAGANEAYELQQIFSELLPATPSGEKDIVKNKFKELIKCCKALYTIQLDKLKPADLGGVFGDAKGDVDNPFSKVKGAIDSPFSDAKATAVGTAAEKESELVEDPNANAPGAEEAGSNQFSEVKATATVANEEKAAATAANEEPADGSVLSDVEKIINEDVINVDALGGKDLMKGINILREILELYYKYVFLPHYNGAFKASGNVSLSTMGPPNQE
ncbi:MAG: hypothetical protein LBJ45_02100 [Holosporaceae bacterium]|jgi:hypothetical protein|nr:hypothetical protein [Holosporaceae bacterium]